MANNVAHRCPESLEELDAAGYRLLWEVETPNPQLGGTSTVSSWVPKDVPPDLYSYHDGFRVASYEASVYSKDLLLVERFCHEGQPWSDSIYIHGWHPASTRAEKGVEEVSNG